MTSVIVGGVVLELTRAKEIDTIRFMIDTTTRQQKYKPSISRTSTADSKQAVVVVVTAAATTQKNKKAYNNNTNNNGRNKIITSKYCIN